MRRMLVTALAAVSLLAMAPSAASATTIVGVLNFGGGATNFYSPGSALVGAGVEFNYVDGANQDSANFTANSLLLSDNVLSVAGSWHQTFTADTAGFFNGASLGANSFPGLSWSVTNDTLTVDWAGTQSPGLRTANFSFEGGGPGVPEPATWMTMILGMAAIGVALRRARKLGAFAPA